MIKIVIVKSTKNIYRFFKCWQIEVDTCQKYYCQKYDIDLYIVYSKKINCCHRNIPDLSGGILIPKINMINIHGILLIFQTKPDIMHYGNIVFENVTIHLLPCSESVRYHCIRKCETLQMPNILFLDSCSTNETNVGLYEISNVRKLKIKSLWHYKSCTHTIIYIYYNI